MEEREIRLIIGPKLRSLAASSLAKISSRLRCQTKVFAGEIPTATQAMTDTAGRR